MKKQLILAAILLSSLQSLAQIVIPSLEVRKQFSSRGLLQYDSVRGIFSVPITDADIQRWNAAIGIAVSPRDTANWNKVTTIRTVGTGRSLVSASTLDNLDLVSIGNGDGTNVRIDNGTLYVDALETGPVAKIYTGSFVPRGELYSVATGSVTMAVTLPNAATYRRKYLIVVNRCSVAITVNGASLAANRAVTYATLDNVTWTRILTSTIQ